MSHFLSLLLTSLFLFYITESAVIHRDDIANDPEDRTTNKDSNSKSEGKPIKVTTLLLAILLPIFLVFIAVLIYLFVDVDKETIESCYCLGTVVIPILECIKIFK